MPEVKLKGISKSFNGVVALNEIDLSIKDKDYVVLLGPSGCGKTSLLKTIAGIYPPSTGSVFVGGKNITNLLIEERGIGMMFQNYALFPHLSAEENASYGPKMKELSPKKITEIARQMLSLAKFPLERMSAMPRELSGGMQQRVALARALASQSSLLLFDEPLSALDAKIGEELRRDLRKLVKSLGLTAIHVTHSQEEAMSIADTMVVMNKGRIMQVGTPEDIYFHPANLFVADFIGEANFFEGEIMPGLSKRIVRFLGRDFDLSKADISRLSSGVEKVMVVFRPEKMVLSKHRHHLLKRARRHKENFVKAKIESRTFLGEKVRYDLSMDSFTIISKRLGFGKRFNKGDFVFVSFDASDAMLFDYPKEQLEKIVGRQTA